MKMCSLYEGQIKRKLKWEDYVTRTTDELLPSLVQSDLFLIEGTILARNESEESLSTNHQELDHNDRMLGT